MNARTASIIVVAVLAIQIVYNSLGLTFGFITTRQFACQAFVVPGAIFAIVEIVFGIYAKRIGDKDLPGLLRVITLFGIISGVCFFVMAVLFMLGVDYFDPPANTPAT